MQRGASGKPAITPGKPETSRLLELVTTSNAALRMPKSDDPLSAEQINLLRQWIKEGAKYDGTDTSAPLKSLLGARQHPAPPKVYNRPVPVMALAFAPDGKTLAVGGYNEVMLWNSVSGKLSRRISGVPQRIQSLAFAPDGKMLLVAGGTPGEYGEVALLELATGKRSKVLDTLPDIALTAVFNADGTQVAAGGADASVRVYDMASGQRVWTSSVHSDWVTSVAFSGDNKFVASASKDMTVKVHDAATGTLFTTYQGHNRQIGQYSGQNPVYAVQFVPGTETAYSAGGGKWIQVWDPIKTREESGDAADMEERFARQGHARYLAHGFSQDVFALTVQEGQLFAASGDGIVKQLDANSGQEIHTYKGHSDWVFALSYHATTHRLATGTYNGEVRVWDTQSGQCVLTFAARP